MLASKTVICTSLKNTTKHIQHLQRIKNNKIVQRHCLMAKIRDSLQMHYVNHEDLQNLEELHEINRITLEIEQIEQQLINVKKLKK